MIKDSHAPVTTDDAEPGVEAVELPPGFVQATRHVRQALSRCENAKLPVKTALAAMMTELIPRLVTAYGTAGVVTMFRRLAEEVAASSGSSKARH